MLNYTLGTIEASEALIKDLYIDLRAKVNAWSKITQQTPQARMGYVGQHLVSVVTGYLFRCTTSFKFIFWINYHKCS